ncbi:hypothetical protein HYH03_005482 [Edaphochlamys debaryana]|uniref:Uncharacterized protein n=1 Tax=Edaphochlamys debaryana TaxID=47281 RepID=A0A836C2C0_9CHLO|nr:hypothetical protein HYH03_005482 [Edaphochlamys debaryana]|eukprot:KAG2496662.1 hypothetical protein HYH03_005482 [Edaphochlamys debaryana]
MGRSGLVAARLVSRSFRAFVDGEVTELRQRLELVLAGPPAALYDPIKHWLNRWPRCTKVTLHAAGLDPMQLATPFAAASPEAAQRIRELCVVRGEAYMSERIPGAVLLALMGRLLGLEALAIHGQSAPSYTYAMNEQAVMTAVHADQQEGERLSHALSLPPQLTSLQFQDWGWFPCISPSLASRLTVLKLGDSGDALQLPAHSVEEVMSLRAAMLKAVPAMARLQHLDLAHPVLFCRDSTLQLLDSLPPTVRRVIARGTVYGEPFGSAAATYNLEGGKLQGLRLTAERCDLCVVTAFLEQAVMLSRALGPRLPHLDLDFCAYELSEEDPEGAGPGAGPKEEFRNDGDGLSVMLRHGPAGGGPGGADGPAGGGPGGPGGAAGGGGGGRGGLAAPPLPFSVLARRALRRMVPSGPWSVVEGQAAQQGAPAAASGASGSAALTGGGGGVGGDIGACELLLRGAAVSSRSSSFADLTSWVQSLAREAEAAAGGQLPPYGIRPREDPLEAVQYLGPVRAAVVRCSSAAMRDRVAAAARGPSCEALPVAVPLYEAISQALQAACDGVEEGGPGGGAGDMERLQWLLGSLGELRNLREARFDSLRRFGSGFEWLFGLAQLEAVGPMEVEAGPGHVMLDDDDGEEGFGELLPLGALGAGLGHLPLAAGEGLDGLIMPEGW